jgi:hypothetical protein
MDALDTKSVSHSLGAAYLNVIAMSAFIFDDTGLNYMPLDKFFNGADPNLRSGGVISINNLVVSLGRRDGGPYDNVGYNDAVMNRGRVFVWYWT